MTRRLVLAALFLAALPRASAAPIHARLSPSGLAWLEDELPGYLPAQVEPPPISIEMWTCAGEAPATFTQLDTTVEIVVDDLALSVPAAGALRVDLAFSAWGAGQAYLDQVYFCSGEETCDDEVAIQDARAAADFSVAIVAGKPIVTVTNVELQVAGDDISVSVSNCPPDDIVNTVVDVAREWALEAALAVAEQIAGDFIAPRLEQILGGFVSYAGSAGAADFDARLVEVAVAAGGIALEGALDLSSPYAAAACLPADPGEPPAHAGAVPALGGGSHFGLAVNLGVVDDALYHVWREGFLCIDPGTLAAFGIELDLDHVGDLLPGFEPGTTFTFEAVVVEPPVVTAGASNEAALSLVVRSLTADLVALPPGAPSRAIHLELDATLGATVRLDPAINALAIHIDAVTVDRFEVDDELGLDDLGFDYAMLRQLVEERVLPKMLATLGDIPLTGPVFGGIAGTYVIVRELATTPAYLYTNADLFHAPDDDHGAPDTTIAAAPARPVAPARAKVLVGGSDAEVPAELLRYRVAIDGVAAEPTFVRQVTFGEAGETRSYRIDARALDLAGNEDPTPATVNVVVDGVLPELTVLNLLHDVLDTTRASVSWEATDDLSAPAAIAARVEIHEVVTSGSVLVSDEDLGAGATSFGVELAPGKSYRMVLTVRDEAGNEAARSMVFGISPDAAGGCGCAVGSVPRPGVPLVPALVLLAAALILRRRHAR